MKSVKRLFWSLVFRLHGFKYYPIGGGENEPPKEPPKEPPAPGSYEDIMVKKGFTDNEAFAKSYGEAEAELSRRQNVTDAIKSNLEKYGYTMNEKGDILTSDGKPVPPPAGQPEGAPGYMGAPQPGYTSPAQPGYVPPAGQPTAPAPMYDAYTGAEITDPATINFINSIPNPVQRQMAITNLVVEQREKWQGQAYTVEQEVLSSPEAQGFEKDVKSVMMKVPLQQRSDKTMWQDALLRVKGAKYDQAMKTIKTEGVNEFLNKAGNQQIPGVGAAVNKGGVKLTDDQERTYKHYEQTKPGYFKDRAEFAKYLTPTAEGR